ncbi:MFS transporter [Nocardia pseudobrasiliensis]|uniref:MFS transporter n=1 Tax=Nocardia pseudobrasiliensis TaxID=45979 RepID=A0A370HT27_9NOCA|nr:MFS transporter [Nocardia pseudobrasiliensis]RDI61676.1 MFS transporter [Nocardia pseudobrasiliensis]
MHSDISSTRRIGAMVALSFGVLSYGLMQTMLVPALGVLQRALHASTSAATWAVLSAPLLASAVLTPVIGRLGDRYGRRRTLLTVLAVYLIATVIAAAAPNIGVLIAARAAQGISLAILPLAFGSVPRVLPPERVHGGLGLLAGLVSGAAGIALVCGGLIVDHASWRWLFVSGAGLIAVTAALTYAFVPEGRTTRTGGLDPAGTVLLAGGLSGILLALTFGPTAGWLAARTLGTAVLGAASLAGFLALERRLHAPLIDPDLVLHRRVGVAHLAIFALGVVQFLYYVLVPKLVELPRPAGGFAGSVTTAGLVMLPSTLIILPAGALAGHLIRRHGPRLPMAAGLLAAAAGAALLALAHGDLARLAICALPIGLGTALVMAAAPAHLHQVVDQAHGATANGINTVARTVGGALGSQLAAALTATSLTVGVPRAFWLAAVVAIVGAAIVFGRTGPSADSSVTPKQPVALAD